VCRKEGLIVPFLPLSRSRNAVEYMTIGSLPFHIFLSATTCLSRGDRRQGVDAGHWRGSGQATLTHARRPCKIPVYSVTNTLECAGNGSRSKVPEFRASSGAGAVGNARFSGPSLKSLLEKAGVKDTAKARGVSRLRCSTRQGPAFYSQHPYRKGHGRRYAVATHMNGARDPASRYPARVITPGWPERHRASANADHGARQTSGRELHAARLSHAQPAVKPAKR